MRRSTAPAPAPAARATSRARRIITCCSSANSPISMRKPAALVFTSGYVANDAALSTLASQLPGCIIFSDALNHNSMIDGIRHGRTEKQIFRHNDPADLERLSGRRRPGAAEAGRVRIRLFHGRRHRPDRRALRRRGALWRAHLSRRGACGRALRAARRRHRRARRRRRPRRHHPGHARQGVRHHRRLHRRVDRAGRLRAQLRPRLHLHHLAAAGHRGGRHRQHPPRQGRGRAAAAGTRSALPS